MVTCLLGWMCKRGVSHSRFAQTPRHDGLSSFRDISARPSATAGCGLEMHKACFGGVCAHY